MQIYLSLHHIVIAAVITASLAPQYDMLVHGSDTTHTQWIVLDTNGQVLDVDPAPYISKQQERLLSKERKSHVEKKIVPTLDRVTFEDPVEILPSSSANDRKSISIDVPVDTVEVRNTLDSNSEVEIVVELVQPPINTDVKLEKSESVISSQGIIPSTVPVHIPVDTIYVDDEEDEFAPGFFLPEFKVKEIEASEQAIYRIKEFQIVRLVSDVFGWKGIEGSILFAEVSCYAVAMAAEAVYAAGLYGEMPWYEQVIMMISVLGALVYQVLVGAWYFEWLSSETMLSCTTVIIMMTVLKMVIPSLHSSLIWIFTGQLPHQYDPVPPSAGKPTSSTSKSFKHGRHTSKSSSAA